MKHWKTTSLQAGLWLVSSLTLAAPPETAIGVRWDVGYDSNPLRISRSGPAGLFTQLRCDAALKVELGATTAFFVDTEGWSRMHESGRSLADYWGGDVRAGITFSAVPFFFGRTLDVEAGGLYATRRSTFTDRFTGEVYETLAAPVTDPSTFRPIPDRFDYESTGAFGQVRLRVNPRVSTTLQLELEKLNYGNDYAQSTTLYSLDNTSLTLEPGVSFKINDKVSVGASVSWRDLDYDSRPAQDEQGDSVADTRTEYRLMEYRFLLQLRPSDPWKLRAGLNGGGRKDGYVGYGDYGTQMSWLSMDRRIGEKNQFQLYASARDLDYDHATVSGLEDGELRGQRVRRYLGRFERKLRLPLKIFAEGGIQRVDSSDLEFAYDRNWMMTGVEYRR